MMFYGFFKMVVAAVIYLFVICKRERLMRVMLK